MYTRILIIIFIILFSYLLKKIDLLNKKDGEVILNKVIFYLVLPAAVFLTMSQIPFSVDLIFLPLSAVGIILICFVAAFLFTKWSRLERKTKGVLIISTMIMNMGMVAYPLFQFVYGKEGFARAVLFDFGNGFLTFSLVYFLAVYYGNSAEKTVKDSLFRFLKLPPIWALLLGIGINLAQISLPVVIKDTLDLIGKPLIFLLLVSLGLYFEPKLNKIGPLLGAIFIRIGVGLIAGFLMVEIFNLEGLNRVVVLISSIMPAGYNTLVFAAKERLDEDFAASVVFATVVISLILIPILSFFFK